MKIIGVLTRRLGIANPSVTYQLSIDFLSQLDFIKQTALATGLLRAPMSPLVRVARWIAVLPAAFACALLVTFPVHWIVVLVGLFDQPNESMITVDGKGLLASIEPQLLERFGYALFIPMVLIIVGAKVAPHFKFQTGIGLAILWGILFGAAVAFGLTRALFEWTMLINFALTVAGVAVGLWRARKIEVGFVV